ncbi:hypothetical protein M2164_000244 [Streptomyces sp. SAI-208]|nr:hypothetical protein [Streptomyces sp. SAI-090]MDH6545932.1 hypothetical protein [Streptomyces sp. SAI-041]MDH6565035.1 hypothetical protein [Streptomyces sp. SAI-117]MDH6604609.1 hypothetical protein [Streptomyces sp. SAI-208]MDH6622161.1 hypothetical protein [Streptomyces sp. SAI-135]
MRAARLAVVRGPGTALCPLCVTAMEPAARSQASGSGMRVRSAYSLLPKAASLPRAQPGALFRAVVDPVATADQSRCATTHQNRGKA